MTEPQVVQCDGCSTMVVWGTWPKSGKRMCAQPDPKGNLVLIDGAWFVVSQLTRWRFGEFYSSHFITCPKAKEFRRH